MKIDPFTVVSDNCYTLDWHGSVVVRTYIVLYSVRCLSKQLWKAGSINWQIVLKFCPCERQCSFSLGNQIQLQIVFWWLGLKSPNYHFILLHLQSATKLWRHIVLKRGNFGKQNNTHPSSLPTIQKLGCCCFLQAAQTAAQHFMDGLGMENFIFSFLRWQTVRVSQLILLPIVGQRWCSLGDCIWHWLSMFILPRKPKKSARYTKLLF